MNRYIAAAVSVSCIPAQLWAETDPDDAVTENEATRVVVIQESIPIDAEAPSTRTVNQDVIDLLPKRSADDLLRTVPGLHISQHAAEGKGQQFFLRGFDAVHGADLAVSVAGIQINEASNVHGHGYVDIGFVIPEVVQAVTARKGSFDLSQGDFATAGSVDLSLGVEQARRGQRMGYEIGSTGRHRGAAIIAPKDLPEESFLAAEAMSDSGFGQNRAAQRVSVMAQHRIDLSPTSWLEVLGSGYRAQFDEPGTVPLADVESGQLDFYDTYAQGDGESKRALGQLRLRRDTGSHRLDAQFYGQWRDLTLAENFTGFLLFPEMGDLRGQTHTATTVGSRTAAEWDLSPRLTVIARGQAQLNSFSQTEDQLDQDGNAWQQNRDLKASLGSASAATGVRFVFGDLQGEVGARLDTLMIDATDRQTGMQGSDSMMHVAPRAKLRFAVTDNWSVFGGYGHGLRSPEARSVVEADSASAFTTSRGTEIGVDGVISPQLSVGLTGFGVLINNEFVFDHLRGVNMAQDATRRLGVEARAELRPASWARLRADVTAVNAEFVDTEMPVPNAPTLLARAEGQARHSSGVRAGAQFTFMGARPLANGAEGAAFAVLDLMLGYRVGALDFTLQVDNALGSQWREGEFHYASRFDLNAPSSQLPRLHYAAGRPLGARLGMTMWF